jgi:hypothetical protein
MSGDYKLEVIIADDRLEPLVRRYIAGCQVNFRHSLEQPLPNELIYQEPSIILTEPSAPRVDPPSTFTAFTVILIVVLFIIFVVGLFHQKLNLNLFPSGGVGLITNFIFVGCLGLVLFFLFKFWSSWTFIETIQCFVLASTVFAI